MAGALLKYNGQALQTPSGAYGINNLVPENVKSGVNIGGVVGTMDDNSGLLDYIQGDTTELISNTIERIGNRKLPDTYYLTKLYLPNCITISSMAFENFNTGSFPSVQNFIECYLPNVETIGNQAFMNRGANFPTTLELPKCKTIYPYAFYTVGYQLGNNNNNHKGLKNLILPNVEEIGACAFQGYSQGSYYYYCGVEQLNLPKCKTLGDSAFKMSRRLTSATLDSCESIGTSCFASCSALTSITLGASQVCTLANTNSIPASSTQHITIYVPANLIESYKVASYWSTLYNNGYITFVAISE